jgi:prepilin-type N-terminal cleavage/methylation domain-containing protein
MAAEGAARTQRGETLIESLVAIVILTAVALASYAAFRTAITVSVQHKEVAVAETLLRTAAERLQDPTEAYVPRAGCAGAGTYGGLPSRPGYVVVTQVRFWQPPSSVSDADVVTQFAPQGACPTVDPGLQSIELQVLTPSGYVERLQILKRAT